LHTDRAAADAAGEKTMRRTLPNCAKDVSVARGAAVQQHVERKLAAIVAADVAGCSRRSLRSSTRTF
jgi:hypothetical protein